MSQGITAHVPPAVVRFLAVSGEHRGEEKLEGGFREAIEVGKAPQRRASAQTRRGDLEEVVIEVSVSHEDRLGVLRRLTARSRWLRQVAPRKTSPSGRGTRRPRQARSWRRR